MRSLEAQMFSILKFIAMNGELNEAWPPPSTGRVPRETLAVRLQKPMARGLFHHIQRVVEKVEEQMLRNGDPNPTAHALALQRRLKRLGEALFRK